MSSAENRELEYPKEGPKRAERFALYPTDSEITGKPSIQVIQHILKGNSNIRKLHFRQYQVAQVNILNETKTGDDNFFSLSREEVLQGEILDRQIQKLDSNENIQIDAKVETIEGDRYLPMMDLEIQPGNPEHLNLAMLQFRSRGIFEMSGVGYILSSGNSYHFIGSRLLTRDEYLEFLGRCLITKYKYYDERGKKQSIQIVDDGYIGCSILYERGLRISGNGQGKKIPQVVEVIH